MIADKKLNVVKLPKFSAFPAKESEIYNIFQAFQSLQPL